MFTNNYKQLISGQVKGAYVPYVSGDFTDTSGYAKEKAASWYSSSKPTHDSYYMTMYVRSSTTYASSLTNYFKVRCVNFTNDISENDTALLSNVLAPTLSALSNGIQISISNSSGSTKSFNGIQLAQHYYDSELSGQISYDMLAMEWKFPTVELEDGDSVSYIIKPTFTLEETA